MDNLFKGIDEAKFSEIFKDPSRPRSETMSHYSSLLEEHQKEQLEALISKRRSLPSVSLDSVVDIVSKVLGIQLSESVISAFKKAEG